MLKRDSLHGRHDLLYEALSFSADKRVLASSASEKTPSTGRQTVK
jgi:hypothetical protein